MGSSTRDRSNDLPLTFLGALSLVAVVAAWILVEAEAAALAERGLRPGKEHYLARAAQLRGLAPHLVLGIAPLLVSVLALFHARILRWVRGWTPGQVAGWVGFLCVWCQLWTSVEFFSAKRFDLYLPVILYAAAVSCVLAAQGLASERNRLTGLALVLWLFLWVPFDLRWYRSLWLGPGKVEYAAFALMVTLVGIATFGVVGRQDTLGVRRPRWGDLAHGVGWLLAFGLLAIPIGLLIGFIKTSPPAMGPGMALLVAAGLALTVALPEELFFRGVLDARLRDAWVDKPWLSLLVSSLAFGLMHWNNASSLGSRIAYVGLATLAGVFYGLAFRKSRGLTAPVLCHTLVDLVWQVFLRG